ncbi:hypothetical protein [Streptomyces sp. CB01881]|uniref:hypothetical protein n=1 Tax=Streptomyces sp. CB01881 TaxID=2078691 RepID=UPI000CDC7ECA|nr:hypothetical protein [Streptomyces sp. CB01881]AUY51660.1 hypothetical protein C2142_25080 [Streptomyces sp. CB01881]TYC71091.1 hypothetical protein EH183_25070 [Streptomyces sp. CB01881]
MGIFDRFRHKAHDASEEARSSLGGSHEQDTTAMTDPAQRAALAHDEAADAFGPEIEKARETQEAAGVSDREAEERAREDMTAEGDPWD